MSLFTIEQLELIKRLRSTGITAEMVIQAFRELALLDCDLLSMSIEAETSREVERVPEEIIETNEDTVDIHEATETQEEIPEVFSSSPVLIQALQSQPSLNLSARSSSSPSVQEILPGSPLPSDEPAGSLSVQTVPLASAAEQNNVDSFNANTQSLNFPFGLFDNQMNGGKALKNIKSVHQEITTVDNPLELEEFMQQGEEACISDMKDFISQYSLRQTTVASMTGVSQPYISKLLNGNHRELSLRCRKNIYSWYLNFRRHPRKLASFLSDPGNRLETNGDGELLPQKRERYVFRPVLIKMLENFFSSTPFPDMNRRLEIAQSCNAMLQIEKSGAPLMIKEVVTPQVIANWFANKRKDLRRRTNMDSNPLPRGQIITLDGDLLKRINAGEPRRGSTGEQSSNASSAHSPSSFSMDIEDIMGIPRSSASTSPESKSFDNQSILMGGHMDAVNSMMNPPLNMLEVAARLGLTLPTSTANMQPEPMTALQHHMSNPNSLLAQMTAAHSSSVAVSEATSPIMALANQILSQQQQHQNNNVSLASTPLFLNNPFRFFDSQSYPLFQMRQAGKSE